MTKVLSQIIVAGLVILAGILGMTASFAEDSRIRIDEVWARATPGAAKTGAVYLAITNTGTTPDRLVSVSTPVADRAEPHTMKMENGVMEMRPLGPVTIAPGQTVVFEPSANHIMLTGLKAPLKEGDSFPLTLSFEQAGSRDVTAAVASIGAMHAGDRSRSPQMPGMSGMSGMQH